MPLDIRWPPSWVAFVCDSFARGYTIPYYLGALLLIIGSNIFAYKKLFPKMERRIARKELNCAIRLAKEYRDQSQKALEVADRRHSKNVTMLPFFVERKLQQTAAAIQKEMIALLVSE